MGGTLPTSPSRPTRVARGGAAGCQAVPVPSPVYAERLHAPLRWWAQSTMLLATLWLAFVVATPAWVAWTATGVLLALTYGLLAWWGSARVVVRDGELHAGRARIPLELLGEPRVLDVQQTRRVLGVEADARAYLLTRPWLKRAVQVPVLDPADPAPYWLLSTRHPAELARALAPQGAEGSR